MWRGADGCGGNVGSVKMLTDSWKGGSARKCARTGTATANGTERGLPGLGRG